MAICKLVALELEGPGLDLDHVDRHRRGFTLKFQISTLKSGDI